MQYLTLGHISSVMEGWDEYIFKRVIVEYGGS